MTPLRVLIVEDESMIAMLYTEVLASLGHDDCAIVQTEDEAVSTARSFRPDLLIVDLHLRIGSGKEAVSRIVAEAYIPHVFVSGDPTRDAVGNKPVYLQKPFNEAQLVRAIEDALEQRPNLTP